MTGSVNSSFGSIKYDEKSGLTTMAPKHHGVNLSEIDDIKYLIDTKPVERNKTTIEANSKKLGGLTTLQTHAEDMREVAKILRKPSPLSQDDDIYRSKLFDITMPGGLTAGSYLKITSTGENETGNFTLRINRLASFDNVNSTINFPSKIVQPLTVDTIFTLPKSDGSGNLDINIPMTSTLTDIATLINDQVDVTGIQATIVQVSAVIFVLNLHAKITGTPINLSNISAARLAELGLTTAGSGATQAQLSAELIFNYVTLTRTSNTITDLIPNAEISLVQSYNTADIQINIKPNAILLQSALNLFVETYNKYIDFYDEQDDRDETGKLKETAILNRNQALMTLHQKLIDVMTNFITGIDPASGFSNITAIGYRIGANFEVKDNKLYQFDDTKMTEDYISANYDSIVKLFALTLSPSTSNLVPISRPERVNSGLAGVVVTVTVTALDGTNKPQTATISATINSVLKSYAATVTNGIIYGPAGTEFDEFSFAYNNLLPASLPAAATVQVFRGIADQLYSDVFQPALDTGFSIADALNGVLVKGYLLSEQDGYKAQIAALEQKNTETLRRAEDAKDRRRAALERKEEKLAQLEMIRNSNRTQFASLLGRNNN